MKREEISKFETSLVTKNNAPIIKNSVEIGKAAIGALVGLIIGGPIGAVVGSVTAPVISLAEDIASKALERRRNRLERIVEEALILSSLDISEVLTELSHNDNKTDDILSLLKVAMDSDHSLDVVFRGLLSELIKSKETDQSQRILIIGDAVRNFRLIHLEILSALLNSGGILKASEISSIVNIPEIELRSVVRDLELRGMIKDLEKTPIEWELRELGKAVAQFTKKNEEI